MRFFLIDYRIEYWNCKNTAYLEGLLEKYFSNTDWDSVEESEIVDSNCKKIRFKGCYKAIYCFEKCQTYQEYFTKETWHLFQETKNYHIKSFNTFILFYEKNFNEKWLKCIAFIDDYIFKISNIMGVSILPKIDINIISKDVMRSMFATESISGFYDPLKDKIYLDDLDVFATHEITHAIMNKWGIRTNIFCNESLAECFKKPICIPREYINNIRTFKDIFFDWKSLCVEKYGVGGLFFRFIFEEYGINIIKKICIASCDADMQKTYDIIKSTTKDSSFVNSFVQWFKRKKLDREDWYFSSIYEKCGDGIK